MREVNIKLILKLLTSGLMLLGLFLYVSLPAAAPDASAAGADLIRLHVLANSDSEADQALKHKVRDEIIKAMAPEFLASGDIDSARLIARANLDRIELIASRVIKAEGKDYPVTAEMGNFPFPTKHYGGFILPAGDYEAVRVVIGSGGGTNWWCVLFPPLCFVDMTRYLAAETYPTGLSDNLSTPEIDTAFAQRTEDTNNSPLTPTPDLYHLDGQETQIGTDINNVIVSEDDEYKVIFSFKFIEWLSRL